MEVVLRLWRAPLVRAGFAEFRGFPTCPANDLGCCCAAGLRRSPGLMPEKEEFVARRGQPQTRARRTAPRNRRRGARPRRRRHLGARARRSRGRDRAAARPGHRSRHAHGSRPSRCCCATSTPGSAPTRPGATAQRAEQLKRLDGIATILAKTAVRDPALLALLAEDAVVSDAARSLKREMLRRAGIETAAEEAPPPRSAPPPPRPASCRSRSSRGSWPTRSSPPTSRPPGRAHPAPTRLAGWELLGPLLSSFERAGGGASACMALPAPSRPAHAGRPGADAAPGAAGRRGRGRPPDLPARRRAGPGQDGSGAARRGGGERLPAARRRAERREDELGCARPACGRRAARPP